MYRELKKINSPQINGPIKKWATELNRTFSKEESKWLKITWKTAHHLVIKETQIKTILRLYLTPVGIATIKNTKNNKYWQECVEKEPLYLAGGNVS
jgi:hypothetical protein